MPDNNDRQVTIDDGKEQPSPARSEQEQTDPQITELRGFTDPKEDLEPTLTDGTKAPDKAESENRDNQIKGS